MGRIYLADIKIQQYIDGLAASGEAISPVYGLVIGQVRDVEKTQKIATTAPLRVHLKFNIIHIVGLYSSINEHHKPRSSIPDF